MAFGLNRAELIGRLGGDVVVNHLQNGGRVANLSIATDESYIDKTGERKDRTEWHRNIVSRLIGQNNTNNWSTVRYVSKTEGESIKRRESIRAFVVCRWIPMQMTLSHNNVQTNSVSVPRSRGEGTVSA